MSALHKPFIFPVTGNTLIRMCQDAYEGGHKSLTVVLRPRIRIIVGDVDTACKTPRPVVENNAAYDRNANRQHRRIKSDERVSGRAGTRRVHEHRRMGPDNEISRDNVLNIASVNDEATEVTNESEIRTSLTTLSDGSSDSSDEDSDSSGVSFVYKPSDAIYASSSKQTPLFESTGSVTTSATTRKPSSVSPSSSSTSFSKPQSQQSGFQSWQSLQSATSSIFDEVDEQISQPSSILSFIKPMEKEELEQLALYSCRNPPKEHRYRFRTTSTLSQMKVTLVLDYKRLEGLKLGGGNKWYSGNVPTVAQKQQLSQNLKCAYRFAHGYQYFIENRQLNENEIITLVQANQRRFLPKLELAMQVYDLFTELGDKAFDRASSMELTFLGRYSPPQRKMILDYVKQYKESCPSEYNPDDYDTLTETSSISESSTTWW